MLWWQPHSLFLHLQSVFFMDLVEFFHWKIFIVLLKLVSGTDIKEDHIACIEQPFFVALYFVYGVTELQSTVHNLCYAS